MPLDASLVERDQPPLTPVEVSEESVRRFCAGIGVAYDGRVPPTWPILPAFEAMNAFLAAEQLDLHRVVHGEQRFTYQRPIVIGDVLSTQMRVLGLRQLGGAEVIATMSQLRDPRGELVCSAKATLVYGSGS